METCKRCSNICAIIGIGLVDEWRGRVACPQEIVRDDHVRRFDHPLAKAGTSDPEWASKNKGGYADFVRRGLCAGFADRPRASPLQLWISDPYDAVDRLLGLGGCSFARGDDITIILAHPRGNDDRRPRMGITRPHHATPRVP